MLKLFFAYCSVKRETILGTCIKTFFFFYLLVISNDLLKKKEKRNILILCYINFQGSIQVGTRLSLLYLLFRIWQISDLLCGTKILLVETSLVKLRFHSQASCQVKPVIAILNKNRRTCFFFKLLYYYTRNNWTKKLIQIKIMYTYVILYLSARLCRCLPAYCNLLPYQRYSYVFMYIV